MASSHITHLTAFARRSCALVLSAGLVSVGCTRSDATVGDNTAELRSDVRIALTFTRISTSADVGFEGQGHFVRYSPADADEVPTLLGIPDDDSIPLDTCRLLDSAGELDRALAAVPSTAEVSLLDAGRLVVRSPVESVHFVPKHYPEITPFVAGVIYGPQDSVPMSFEPGSIYDVSGEGGEEIGPFQAQTVAPRSFPSLVVPVYHRGSDLDLRWSEAGEVSDPMVITVGWASRAGALEVRCRVRDDGSFTVSRDLLASMPADHQLSVAEVSALRSRRSAIVAPGASRGVMLVGLREVATLTVAAAPIPGAAGSQPQPVLPAAVGNAPPESER